MGRGAWGIGTGGLGFEEMIAGFSGDAVGVVAIGKDAVAFLIIINAPPDPQVEPIVCVPNEVLEELGRELCRQT